MFEEFSPVSKSEWLAKIEQDLKGRLLSELNWQPEEDLDVSPFAHPDDFSNLPAPLLKKQPGQPWLIGENFSDEWPPEKLNAQLLNALNYGLESPRFAFRQIPSPEYVQQMLQRVNLSFITPFFYFEEANEEAVFKFVEHLSNKYEETGGTAGEDASNRIGSITVGERALALNGKHLAKAREKLPAYRFIRIAGFGTANEGIIEGLQDLLQQIRNVFGESRMTISDFAKLLLLELETGRQYFLEIARLRALRILWEKMWEKDGMASPPQAPFLDVYLVLHDTGEMQQGFDEKMLQERINKDMIAAAPLALAALLGGADRLTIPPAGSPLRPPDDFTRRIARNVHHILRMESGLHLVADPLAGSWYVEKLTGQIVDVLSTKQP